MGQKTILLIEADPRVASRIEGILDNAGYQFTTAKNGAEGLRKAFSTFPDLIISNTALPQVSGVQVVQILNFLKVTIPAMFVAEQTEFLKYKNNLPQVKDTCLVAMISEELEVKIEAIFEEERHYEDIICQLEIAEFLGLLSTEDRKKVLIASDPVTAKNLYHQLDSLDYYELYLATDGREALFKAVSLQPDLLLVSTELDQLEGKSLAQILYILGHSIPIIFMQPHQDPKLQAELEKLEGVMGFWSTGQVLSERKFFFDGVQKAVSLNSREREKLDNSYKEIDTMNLKGSLGSSDILDDPTLFQEFDDVDLD